VPPDLIPLLTKNKQITVKNNDPLGSMGMIRFNFLHPPFNNEKDAPGGPVRGGPETSTSSASPAIRRTGKPCYSYFTCGTPLSSEIGAEPLKKRDYEKAKQLIKEAGYKGEKVVIIDATDQPIVHSQSLLTLENLKKIGINAEIQAGDWGTLITRRTVKEPPDKGGWNIFHTWLVGPDMVNPAVNFPIRGMGEKSWFGWPRTRRWRSCARRGSTRRPRPSRKRPPTRCRSRPSSRSLHPDGPVHPSHGVPLEHHGPHHRPDQSVVERGEEVTPLRNKCSRM
jgi:peptide/nickel transport system substrate-binding protein